MKRLGFMTSVEKECGVGASQPSLNPTAIFTFDSGAGLTLDDAVHHLLVLGGTGSGKTASVAMPLAKNLISAGLGGLICDIKGNMGDDIAKVAAISDRSADIVEYGSEPSARKVNLLKTMTVDGRRRFLESLAKENFSGENMHWAVKGAHIAADCAMLLDFLVPSIPGLDPTIGLISEMVDNFAETAALWKTFRKSVFNNDNLAHKRFVSGVDNNKFHIFHFGDDKKTGSGSSRNSWDEQVTWNLQGIRMGLRSFLDAPGVLEKFSVQGAPGLDIARDVMNGKLILVRFGLTTGPVGAKLTRLIVSEVYRTILDYGLDQRGKEFFVLMDEFQELADLSNGRFSDKNFVALARSFGGIFVGLTQSLASIRCEGNWSLDAVESFASNCNNTISFYSTDPATQEMARLHDPDIFLNDLEPNHAFVVRYDKSLRRHTHGIETMNGEYEAFRSRMESAVVTASAGCHPGKQSQPEQKSLYDIVTELERPRVHPQPAGESKTAFEGVNMESSSPGSVTGCVCQKAGYAQDLAARYPEIFSRDASEISVPVGWREHFEKALRIFRATGLTCAIERVTFKHDVGGVSRLLIFEKDQNSISGLLKDFLNSLSGICMVCGKSLPDHPVKRRDVHEEGNIAEKALREALKKRRKQHLGSTVSLDDVALEEEWEESDRSSTRAPSVSICDDCLENFGLADR